MSLSSSNSVDACASSIPRATPGIGDATLAIDGDATTTDAEGMAWALAKETLTASDGRVPERLAVHRAFRFGWVEACPETRSTSWRAARWGRSARRLALDVREVAPARWCGRATRAPSRTLKMQPRPVRTALALCALPWLLIACGGSGSDDAPGAAAGSTSASGGLPAADGTPAGTAPTGVVNGFVEVRRTDRDADGNLLLLATKTLDADANRLVESLERFGDGGYVASSTLDYDGAGNLVREAYVAGDFDSDTRYEHDADGVLRRALYANADGVADTTTFEYDAAGRLTTRSTFDVDEDGPLLTRSTYEYAADGLPESGLDVQFDPSSGSIVLTVRERYVHDAQGRLAALRFDDNDDGSVDASFGYTWDEDGNMVRRDELDAAGALVATEEYEYETAPEPIYNRWLRAFRYFL